MRRNTIHKSISNAIDIGVPYNIWRVLHGLWADDDGDLRSFIESFDASGTAKLPCAVAARLQRLFSSSATSEETTLATMRGIFEDERNDSYLVDPHTSVAISAVMRLAILAESTRDVVVVATAHAAKFPEVVTQALGCKALPPEAEHPSLVTKTSDAAVQHANVSELADHMRELISRTGLDPQRS